MKIYSWPNFQDVKFDFPKGQILMKFFKVNYLRNYLQINVSTLNGKHNVNTVINQKNANEYKIMTYVFMEK